MRVCEKHFYPILNLLNDIDMLPWIKKNALVFYFLLAMLISWSIELPLVAATRGWFSAPIPFAIHYLASFGPMLSAFLTTALVNGKEGLRELGQRIIRWRVGNQWIAFSFISPFILFSIAAGINYLVSGSWPDLCRLGEVNYLPNLGAGVFILWLATFGLGEEIGWRGFALPRLQRNHTAFSATLILGVLWMVWHLPAFFYHETYLTMEWFLLPGMLIGLLFGGVLFTWLYNSTEGSVLMVAIWHALFDLLSASKASGEWVAPVMTAGVIFLAIRILRIHGTKNLSEKNRQVL